MFSRCPTWEDCLREFAQSNLEEWFCEDGDKDFGAPQSYAKNVKNGPSEYVIKRFLGGSFARGHGVRDALAIRSTRGGKPPSPGASRACNNVAPGPQHYTKPNFENPEKRRSPGRRRPR